jgi:serine/threonine protein kinase
LRELDIDVAYFEEIITFAVGRNDANRGPLPNDGRKRFFLSIERPDLTLSGVVRGMLGNQDCQNDVKVRQRYSAKVFSVLRLVAKALQRLHAQGFIHGDLCLENCGKYDDQWKLSGLLGAKKIGETFDSAKLSSSAPPESVEPLKSSTGTKHQAAFRADLVCCPSFDSWAFGKLAYEVLVGNALIEFDVTKNVEDDYDSLANLLHWNDFSVQDAQQQLKRVGISEAGISLVAQCLSPDDETRPSMNEVLKHPVWSEMRQSQTTK